MTHAEWWNWWNVPPPTPAIARSGCARTHIATFDRADFWIRTHPPLVERSTVPPLGTAP